MMDLLLVNASSGEKIKHNFPFTFVLGFVAFVCVGVCMYMCMSYGGSEEVYVLCG